jgi:hypothetical protein
LNALFVGYGGESSSTMCPMRRCSSLIPISEHSQQLPPPGHSAPETGPPSPSPAIMLTLALLGQRLKSFHLQLQYGVLGLLALYRVVVVNLHSDVPQYTHVQMRLITLPMLAAAFYLTAYFTSKVSSGQRL